MRFVVTGDLYISETYKNINIDKQIIQLFNKSNYNIINLEAPILNDNIDKYEKNGKTGPHLHLTSHILKYLKKLNISIVTLANNHIKDFGIKGISNTTDFCNKNNISYLGLIEENETKELFVIRENEEIKVAILNYAENEWSNKGSIRASSYDVVEISRKLQKLKKQYDLIILILHGGHEYFSYPSPRMQKEYRFFVEMGADIVINHHQHVVSGFETYKGKEIYYGLGNFIFTRESSKPEWYEGMLLLLNIEQKDKIRSKIVPIEVSKNFSDAKIMSEKESKKFFSKIAYINQVITNKEMLVQKWLNYTDNVEKYYLDSFLFLNLFKPGIIRSIFNKIKLSDIFVNKRFLMQILNLLRCESHHEASKSVITSVLNKRYKINEK